MKTTKEKHPAGYQVHDINSFDFERLEGINNHLKDKQNYLDFVKWWDKYHGRSQSRIYKLEYLDTTFNTLKELDFASILMISNRCFADGTTIREHLRILINMGKVMKSKTKHKCKVSGNRSYHYKALSPTYWYENNFNLE